MLVNLLRAGQVWVFSLQIGHTDNTQLTSPRWDRQECPLTVPCRASADAVEGWSLYSWAVVKALTLLKAFSEATMAGRGGMPHYLWVDMKSSFPISLR